MRKKFDKGEPITNWTAEDYRDIVRRIEAAGKLTGAAPVRLEPKKSARIMSIDHTQGFYATLSGSTSPYSFTEKYGSSGGTWSTGVRTGTSNAYEVNGTASLNGKTVWLEPGYPGDYRFQYISNSSTTATWTITVLGCTGSGYAGVTVTVVHGGGTVSGTTNGSGVVTFTGLSTGSATATATAPSARFVNSSITRTLSAGVRSDSFSLSVASGYACCGCADPIATTLYGTDSNGTWTFNWTGAGWITCYTATDSTTGADLSCVPTTVTYSRQYTITCAAGGTFTLTAKTSYVMCFPGYTTTGRCNSGAAEVLNSLGGYDPANNTGFSVKTGCLPLSLPFDIPSSGTFAFTVGTVTVTE